MKATAAQVRLFRALFAEAGVALAASRLRRFRALTVGQASLMIRRTREELQAAALASYAAPPGMATVRQLTYFSNLRHRLGEPVSDADIDAAKALTSADMQRLNAATMKRLQDRNDAFGIPVPDWRLARGLYDSELVREGQRAAAARQEAKRKETRERVQRRQAEHPRRERIAYPGET